MISTLPESGVADDAPTRLELQACACEISPGNGYERRAKHRNRTLPSQGLDEPPGFDQKFWNSEGVKNCLTEVPGQALSLADEAQFGASRVPHLTGSHLHASCLVCKTLPHPLHCLFRTLTTLYK